MGHAYPYWVLGFFSVCQPRFYRIDFFEAFRRLYDINDRQAVQMVDFLAPNIAYAEGTSSRQPRIDMPLVVAVTDVPINLNPIIEGVRDVTSEVRNVKTTIDVLDSRLDNIGVDIGGVLENSRSFKEFVPNIKEVDKSVKDVTKNLNTGLENVNKNLGFGQKILDSLGNISGPILNFAGDMASTATTIWGISSILEPWFKVLDGSINTVTSNLTREATTVTNAIKNINPIFKVQGESLILQPSDSPLVRLFKNGMNAVISPINTLNSVFKVQDAGLTVQPSDSSLTKLFKNGISGVIDPINGVKSVFDVGDSEATRPNAYDSKVTKLFKSGIGAVIDPIKALKPIFDVGGTDASVNNAYDSPMTKLFKSGIQAVVSPLKTLNDIFRVSGEGLNLQSADSPLTRLFKNAMNAVISPLDSLNKVFKVAGEGLTLQSSDSPLTRLFKNAMNSIIDAIKKISTGDTSISLDLNPLKESINTGFSSMGATLKDLGSIISNGFSGLLSGITGLFIPKDFKPVTDKFDSLKKSFTDKFRPILGGVDAMRSLFGVAQRDKFPDITVDFDFGDLFGTRVRQEITFKGDYLTQASLIMKPIITGFIFLWFLKEQYDWFHEERALVE